jgi:hypothetical protein
MSSRESSVQSPFQISSELVLPNSTSPLTPEGSQSSHRISAASSIVFIDSRVSDYQTLVSGVQAGTEVHILDSSQDAIAQITQTLIGRSNISSLHILSHGSAGGVQLGADWLGMNTLDRYAPQLQSWARALTDDADILLYGCDVAAGEQGQAFVQSLSQLTGADIAASNDQTGNATLGGDWDLEVSQGTINTPLGFDQLVLAAYEHILPVNLPGYTESVYVSGLPALAAGLTVDLASNTLYLADNSTNGILRKVAPDRTISTVSNNFATNGIYPYVATDIQYANGSVYTSLSNGTSGGNLIQINTSTGTSANLTTFTGFGYESGLANIGSKIYVTSGQGSSSTGEIRQYDLSNNSSAPFANLPQGASSLEFDPVKNKFYFSVMNSGIYSADPTTGAYALLTSTPPGSGNFAIDPSGDYLYTRTNTGEVLRISTANGSTTTFQTGISSDGDLVFGRSSSGSGGSLYVSDGNRLLEVSGFAAPIVPGSGGTGVYTRSNFVENLQRRVTGLAYDQTTRTLYFANDDGTGTLNKVLSNHTVSTVATNFTKGGFYPYASTDIQYANGSVYTSLDNGNLVQIDPSNGSSTIVTNLPGFGGEAGLAFNAGKILITSGNGGVRELREVDPSTGMNTLKNGNLPSGSSSLEYDPVKNKYYFFANGQFFVADPVTGTYNPLASQGGPGNFAIDPSGDYLYTRVGSNVIRVSTADGAISTFQTGFSSSDFGSDLVFGVSSSGVGGSLYIGNDNSIVEISGFGTPPVIPGSGGSTGTYTKSVYASGVGSPAALAFDSATKTLYFAEKNSVGSLRKVGSDRTVSTVATNFANGGFYPYAATDIQFADGSVYTALDSGKLVKINLSNGTFTTVASLPGVGVEAGLAVEAGRILITSGNTGARELREYDPSTGTSKLRIANLPSDPSSFEFDPVRDKYYFSTTTGQFYVADPATGMSSLLASISGSAATNILGNFAIDPFGEFLYTRVGSDIIRISTSNGSTSIFQSGFNSDSFGSDLVFGTASSGNGYSLYVSDFDQIIEISGFSAQVVSNAPSDSYLTLKTFDSEASESPADRATYELRRNNKTGNLVVNLTIDPGSTASINDYILSVNTGRISIVGSTVTVAVPDGVDSVFLNVRPIDDIRGEAAETLKLNLLKGAYVTDAFNNTAATTILANDTPTISINNVTVTEGNSGVTKATFTISLSNPSDLPVSLSYATADETATASSDYTSIANSITFTPGTTSVTVSVDIKGDAQFEQTETLKLILSNAVNATIANGIGTATILNDDSSPWTIAGTGDFDKDGNVDILWRNVGTGGTAIWKMNGTAFDTSIPLPVADANWHIEGVVDFDKDSYLDIFWRNYSTGANAIWKMNGMAVSSSVALSAADISWKVAGITDFDKDGFVDILWRNTNTGGNAIWKMNGTSVATSFALSATASSWQIGGIGDFDHDGFVDILWHNNSTGANAIWKMNGTSVVTSIALSATSLDWQIAGIGDFDNDGTADILWRNSSTGGTAIWRIDGGTVASAIALSAADPSWQVEDIVDFDHDGFVDIVWRNYSTGANAVWKMNGTTVGTSIALRAA